MSKIDAEVQPKELQELSYSAQERIKWNNTAKEPSDFNGR